MRNVPRSAHWKRTAFRNTGSYPQNPPEVPGSHDDPANMKSPLAASQTLGISQAFNLNVTEKYGAGDYLYYFGGIDDAWLGLWGIIRVHKRYKKHLKPLCQGKDRIHALPLCPSKDDVVRRYEVVAIQKDLIYNRYGDHDPNGLVFVPLEDVDNVLAGKWFLKMSEQGWWICIIW